MLFKILYILFFTSQLLLGSTHIVGGITPRHIMTVVMLLFCIIEGIPKLDKTFKLYLVFITLFIFAGIGPNLQKTVEWIAAYYLVAYVGYISTIILIDKYDGVKCLLYTLLVIGLLDAVVTVGQMFQIPYAKAVTNFLSLQDDSLLLELAADRGGMAGIAVPGIVGPVANGYLLSYICILSMYRYNAKVNIINYAFCFFTCFALFCVQERTALVAGLLCSAYIIYKTMSHNKKSRFILLFALIILFVLLGNTNLSSIISLEDTRYSVGFSIDDERSDIFARAFDFIMHHPFGGAFDYKKVIDVQPHNVLLNAGVYSGFLGIIIIICILFTQLMLSKEVLFRKSIKEDYILFLFTLSFVCYTLNSLTHNQSIVTGDPTVWIFWAVILCLSNKNKNSYEFTYQ